MHNYWKVLTLLVIMAFLPAAYAATFVSYGLPESKAIIFGYPGSGSNYNAPYVDSSGKWRIDTVDSVTNIPSLDTVDTVTVVDTVNTVTTVSTVTDVTDVTNVTDVDSVNLVDTVSVIDNINSIDSVTDIAGGDLDTISVVDNVNSVDSITDIAGGDLDTVSIVDNINSVDSITDIAGGDLDTVSVVDTVNTVAAVTNVGSLDTCDTVSVVANVAAGTIDIDYLTESFLTEVERGNISGVALKRIIAVNETLSAAAELINPCSSPEVNAAAAATVFISSDSATDDKDSTGAKSVYVWGKDGSGLDTYETLNIEGQTTVETTALFKYVEGTRVATEGASGQVGNIYVFKGTATAGVPDGSPFNMIPIGYGQMWAGKYQCPSGDTAVLVDVNISTGGTGPYMVFAFAKKTSGAKNLIGIWSIKAGEFKAPVNYKLAALEYLYFAALSANAGDDITINARILNY